TSYEMLLRKQIATGQSIIGRNARPPNDPIFADFAQSWFDTYVKSKNKFSEQRAKEAILRLSLVPFFGPSRVGEISSYQLEKYKAHLIAQGISNKTIRNRLTVLHKCLSCAYEWLQLEASPPRTKWPRSSLPGTDYLSPDECEQLLRHADG